MMKMAMWLASLGWLLLACGGDLREDEPIVDSLVGQSETDGWIESDPVVDYLDGTRPELYAQPWEPDSAASYDKTTYFIPDGYGIAGSGVRCNNQSFPGGVCKIPKSKNWCIKHISDDVAPPTFIKNALIAARARFASYWNARGWNILNPSNDDCGTTFPVIQYKFGDLADNVGGVMTPQVKNTDIVTTPAGKVHPWSRADITIDPVSIQLFPGFSAHNATERAQFSENVGMHEFGHAGGLGHNGIIDTLMDTGPVQLPQISSLYFSDVSPLSEEAVDVQNYSIN